MQTSTFRTFYEALPDDQARSDFRNKFLSRTRLSYPTFDNYKKVDLLKKIPFLYAEKIREIAKEEFPDLALMLEEKQVA